MHWRAAHGHNRYRNEDCVVALRTLSILKDKLVQRFGVEGSCDLKAAMRCVDRDRTGTLTFDQFVFITKMFNCQAPRERLHLCFKNLAGAAGVINVREMILDLIAADIRRLKTLAGEPD